jgi:uncharacterized phiE125 gp8 family phage protein
MVYSLTVKTAAVAEPVTLAEAKDHCRILDDVTDQDALISALIVAAREWCENFTRRSFVRRTYEMRLDNWFGGDRCREILLPRGPVSSVTHVKYTDSAGALATLAADQYQTGLYDMPARIVPAFGVVWPTVKPGAVDAVLIEYVAGYAPSSDSPTDHAANVPASVKAAMKLIVGHLYEQRELSANSAIFEVPFAVKALLAPFEVRDYRLE